MMLVIDPQGAIRGLYDELVDLSALGTLSIIRASHVEPDDAGSWWADLAPVQGPRLGPFRHRSEALRAEQAYLHVRLVSPLSFLAD